MVPAKSTGPSGGVKSSTSPRKPTRLGRGLSALMGQAVQASPPDGQAAPPVSILPRSPIITSNANDAHGHAASPSMDGKDASDLTHRLTYVSIDSIIPNPQQPRQIFNDDTLKQLAESIRNDGLIQPIIIRPSQGSDVKGSDRGVDPRDGQHYELVAGERRWRAARLAGLDVLPAVIRQLDDQQLAEWALIENLQREDLNAIERAEAFSHLIKRFNLSHEEVAQRVGINRPTVSNSLRLLELCDFAVGLVREGLLSAGQAKALAGITDPGQQKAMAQRIVAQGLSVRQVEQAVRKLSAVGETNTEVVQPKSPPATRTHLADLEEQIGRQLGTKARVRSGRKKGSGTLSIEFYSLDQFDELMQKLGVDMA